MAKTSEASQKEGMSLVIKNHLLSYFSSARRARVGHRIGRFISIFLEQSQTQYNSNLNILYIKLYYQLIS